MSGHKVAVPATTKVVKAFLESNLEKFERTLSYVRTEVTKNLSGINVYKIYGREDNQAGKKLKNPRKVRLKFNKHFKDKEPKASLWTVPDIIGFTIVVSFPSDISQVCEVIDKMVDEHVIALPEEGPAPAPVKEGDKNPIKTRFGRAITTDGYFACHYNVVEFGPGGKNKPQCEIQIKTILHDGWGAKSHDLTYKPSSKINADLVKTFEVLGDMLAKIDEQSDIVRNNIERTAAVRQRKKQQVLSASINAAIDTLVEDKELKSVVLTLRATTGGFDKETLRSLSEAILSRFKSDNHQACLVFVYLAFTSHDRYYYQQSLEAIEEWFENEKKALGKAYARSIMALALFVHNDTPSAIDEAENAVSILESINESRLSEDDQKKYQRLGHALLSSLAYYHAEAVGSHDAKLGDGAILALDYMKKSAAARSSMGLSFQLDDEDAVIEEALRHPKLGYAIFSALDNEAFIRIQTAEGLDEVTRVRAKLEFLHKSKPPGFHPAAAALYEFHDFCARDRLTELEKG